MLRNLKRSWCFDQVTPPERATLCLCCVVPHAEFLNEVFPPTLPLSPTTSDVFDESVSKVSMSMRHAYSMNDITVSASDAAGARHEC